MAEFAGMTIKEALDEAVRQRNVLLDAMRKISRIPVPQIPIQAERVGAEMISIAARALAECDR